MDDRPLLAAAPMAGISDRSFRDIVKNMGADMACGEMVSAQALCYRNARTFELLDLEGESSPRSVQLFGAVPEHLREAAVIVREQGAEEIDLNMGCPVPKVVKNGEGSALMLEPELAARIVEATAEAGLPVTVKFRSGWDAEHINAVEFARRMEAAGVSRIAVHGRSREQFYSGTADRRVIAAVKAAVNVPVLANGDVFSHEDALSLLADTGCDGVMVGRGMLGDPWIFQRIRAAFDGESPAERPGPEAVFALALSHLREHIRRGQHWYCLREKDDSEKTKQAGALLACRSMRNMMGWYMKGFRYAAQLRAAINKLDTYEEIEALLNRYLADPEGWM